MSPLTSEPRVIVITGACSGIGRAAAHQLAGRGSSLVLAARSAEGLEQTRQECVAKGAAHVQTFVADVGERGQVQHLIASTAQSHGRVDAVIHSAAVLAYGEFLDIPPDVFDRILLTNVTGSTNVARSTLEQFERQGHGSLVVIGSVLGKIATPYMSAYCTSKWALHGLVRTLQIETRRTPNVHVSLVSPGGVNTPIYEQAGTYVGRPGRPPPPVLSPERVAAKAVRALDRPGRDIAAGPVNWIMVLGFRALPGVFDFLVPSVMRLLGMGRARVCDGPGNVFEPQPSREAVHGRWPRRRGQVLQ